MGIITSTTEGIGEIFCEPLILFTTNWKPYEGKE